MVKASGMEQSLPHLTAQEIKQLGDEDVIGCHRRLPPFLAKGWTGGASPCWPRGEACPLLGFPFCPGSRTPLGNGKSDWHHPISTLMRYRRPGTENHVYQ
jgi:hypothetical protein